MPAPPDQNVINFRTQTTFTRVESAWEKKLHTQGSVVQAQVAQIRLNRAQARASINALLDSGKAYPYSRMRDWIVSKRQAYLLRGKLTPEYAKQIMAQFQDKATAQQNATLQQVFDATQPDDWTRNALEAGAICAGIVGGLGGAIGIAVGVGIGAAAGSAIPVFGTLIGAAIGFVIGVVTALIPVEKWKVMDNFHLLTEKMRPVDRYMLWGTCKRVQDNARALEKLKPLPAWWLKTPDFYTIYGGIDSVAVFMYEDLARQDNFLVSVPPPDGAQALNLKAWDQVALYGCAAMASHGSETEKMMDSLFYKQVMDGRGSPILRPYLELVREMPIGEFRAKTIAAGLRDFNDVPITEDVLNALAKREEELSQK